MHSTLKSACALGAVVLAASSLAVSAHATTAVSGATNQVANATIDGVTVTNGPSNNSWSGVPANLGGFVTATSTNPLTGDTGTVSGLESATWASADAGSVTFTRYGWDFNAGSGPTEGDLTQNRGGSDWTYTFTATSNGTFTMKYNVSLDSGNGFGLWGWSIDANGNPLFNAGNAFDPTASGTVSQALVAGQTYTIDLLGNPNIGTIGGLVQSGRMNGEFDWTITNSVPEPGIWALMLLGFGLTGASLRSRRKLVAA